MEEYIKIGPVYNNAVEGNVISMKRQRISDKINVVIVLCQIKPCTFKGMRLTYCASDAMHCQVNCPEMSALLWQEGMLKFSGQLTWLHTVI